MTTQRTRAAATRVLLDYGAIGLVFVKGLVLVPLYLSHFSLACYGAWLASGSILAVLGLVEGGFTLVFAQRLSLSAGARDDHRFATEAFAGAVVLCTMAVAATGAGIAFGPLASRAFRLEEGERASLEIALRFGAAALGLTFVQTIFASIWDAWQLPHVGGVSRIGGQVCEIVTTVVLLRSGAGLASLPIGAAAGTTFVCVLTGSLLPREWARRGLHYPGLSLPTVLGIANECAPMFVSKVASVAVNNNEPLLAATLVGAESAAVLGLTDRVFKLGQMVINVGALSIYFAICHLRGERGAQDGRLESALRTISRFGGIAIAALVAMLIAGNKGFVSCWVGPQNFGGIALSTTLGVASAVAVRVNLAGLMLSAAGGTRESALSQLLELVVRLPLLWVCIHLFGVIGIPVASLVTTTFLLGPMYVFYTARILGAQVVRRSFLLGDAAVPFALILSSGVCFAWILPDSHGWLKFAGHATVIFITIGVSSIATAFCFLDALELRQPLNWFRSLRTNDRRR